MIVTIERLGHLGHGIVSGENGPIFVPQALPGEVVEGVLQPDGTLAQVRILTPSVDRVRPPCVHARTCGGCLMQHASDGLVAAWKQSIVQTALAAHGITTRFLPIVTSPPRSRRRATLAARRTKTGVMIGFHSRGSDVLVDVPQCQLLHPDLIAAFPAIAALTKLGGSRSAELSFSVTRSLSGLDVVVTGAKPADGPFQLDLARLTETHKLARLTWNGETVALRATPMQRMGRALVAPPPDTFLQATEPGEKVLVQTVALAIGSARRIVDLFAGIGTFSLALAERSEVHAVEGEARMVAALDDAARGTEGLHRVTTEARDLFRRPLEADEFKGFDAVVLDPPRAGAEAQVATLARARVPVIAYVSCSPKTFARDARVLLAAGYRLSWVQVVDQFRWSTHVELVASFAL